MKSAKFILPEVHLRITLSVIALMAITLLTGCPFSSHCQLDETPMVQTDPALMGKWAAIATDEMGKQYPVKLIISEKTDKIYDLVFVGDLSKLNEYGFAMDDSLFAIGNISVIDNRQFMDITIKSEHYIAEIKMENGKLSFLPLSEHFTNWIVRSNDQLKQAIFYHFKTRLYPLYEESFCLREMVKVN